MERPNKREHLIKTAVATAQQNFKSVAVALRYYQYIINNNPLKPFEVAYYSEIIRRIKELNNEDFKGDYE